ncbi:butyrophilin subfamily 2 member A2-like isoform X1 [Sander lucioperca]|uniref:butyrophilin subfamily 2 member A2-like isoform X1 n=1 Tax=Sander lucioperca TaxID=283035 RepID=UPI00125D7312|nr:butyrophilin subfamily 2 member A2-like isoform X1 [Sander lucioperca]
MIHMKDRLLLEPQLSVFSALVLHHTVVLLLLIHSGGGQSQVIGTSQPIVAKVGDDITLPCHLETVGDATDLTVEWARPDLEPRFVYLRRDGVELQLEEHPLYMGRTSLSTKKLTCGDISLKLSKVKLSDAGTYKCLVPKSGTESVVELTVGSVSSPDIKISKVSNGVVLQCESKGWYPEPEVLWLDGEGNLLSAGPTETVRGPDDLYTVSSRVTVEKRHSNSFSCRVQQKNINQTRETTIHLPDDFFMEQSNSAVRITICLAVCFMSVMAVFVLWKCGPHQIKTTNGSTELQHLVEGDKRTQLDMKEEKLDEDLQKNEGDLKHVQQVIQILMNQRDKLNSLLDEDRTQREKNNEKLKNLPKTDTGKKMEKRVKTREDLDRREKEHDELLWNTGELQKTAEQIITIMTERKEKLERDKEKINEHLKETERQREETQKKLQLEQQVREEEKNNPSSNDDK